MYFYRKHSASMPYGKGEAVDKESNKKWHRKEDLQPKNWCSSHKFFNVLFSVTQSLFLLSSMYKWGGPGQEPQNKRTKFLNLLILEHLKNYFIEALNKFLMCFEINGLKNLKLTILRFFAQSPHLYILLYSSKNIFIVKTPGIHIIFILMF